MKPLPQTPEEGFGVYIHWPFCATKCPYCDFNSHVRHEPVDQKRFVNAFAQEIAYNRAQTGPRTVSSIFIGGGTPSLMAPETVNAILNEVRSAWTVPEQIEITIEANPSSVEAGRFRAYRDAGVNRVSLGIQALNDQDLRFLGRLHDVKDAKHAIHLAREIFPRMSFDLIYARPEQSVENWRRELKEAIDLAVDHLSLYQLTIEEGTMFFQLHEAGKFHIPDDDLAIALFETTQEVCAQNYMPQYEVSNHAKLGAESQHNLNYWRYGDYVGLGPGAHGRLNIKSAHGRHNIKSAHGRICAKSAHGRISAPGTRGQLAKTPTQGLVTEDYDQKTATITEKHPEKWLKAVETQGHGIITCEPLSPADQADELLLMGLRLKEGVDMHRWQKLSGRAFDLKQEQNMIDDGLIERIGNHRIRATPSGQLLLNSIIAELA